MPEAPCFCFTSQADKRARYQAEVIPAMLACAQRATRDPDQRGALAEWMRANVVISAKDLHEAARAGRYVPSERDECDPLKLPSRTVSEGGDCDQWAVAVMACLRILGFEQVWLVFSGDDADPYRHAAVEFFAADRMWISDPKFDQPGAPFNQRAEDFPKRSHWRMA